MQSRPQSALKRALAKLSCTQVAGPVIRAIDGLYEFRYSLVKARCAGSL